MSCFERSLEIQVPLQSCFSLWIANDYYPRCPFAEIPTLPTGWSSADAWGENRVDGIRKLTWALVGNLSTHTKSICWRSEEALQGKLMEGDLIRGTSASQRLGSVGPRGLHITPQPLA